MVPRGRALIPVAVVGGLLLALHAARHWLDVVEVRGGSMVPTYRPGDRLLVERWTYRRRVPRRGEVALAADPREPGRELVKRVERVANGRVTLRGDNARFSTDSVSFGSLPASRIEWRVLARYQRATIP